MITVQGWPILLVGRGGRTWALEVPGPQAPLLRALCPRLLPRIFHLLVCLVPQLRGAGDGQVSWDVLQQDSGQLWGPWLWLLPSPAWIPADGPLSLSGTNSAWVLAFRSKSERGGARG